MLLPGEKLRWCGLDLRPRLRRRVLVMLTYALYLTAIWGHIRLLSEAFLLVFVAGIFPWTILKDIEAWLAWTIRAVGVLLIVAVTAIFIYGYLRRPVGDAPAFYRMYVFLWLVTGSALSYTALIDSGARGWMARAVKRPSFLKRWEQRRLAQAGFAVGLEGYAKYEYGLPFRRLTPEQKLEIEEMHRMHPQGEWKRQRSGALYDDERIRQEEDQLRARVQRILSFLLMAGVLVFSVVLSDTQTLNTDVVLSVGWTLAALGTTLRQAIVLWMEDDPRCLAAGEMVVVDEVHA